MRLGVHVRVHVVCFQFLLIFRKAAAGELTSNDGLMEIYNQINEIDVDSVGVGGAKNFFEAKVQYFILRQIYTCTEIVTCMLFDRCRCINFLL